MTGFGASDGPAGGGRLQLDVKTVNHRHLNIQLKLPYALGELEGQFRDAIRQRIDRGHITVAGRWVEEPEQTGEVAVDVDRARNVLAALNALSESLQLSPVKDVTFLARHADVLHTAQATADPPEWPEIGTILHEALSGVIESRAREGTVLGDEVKDRLDLIEERLVEVEARAPERLANERERLRAAVSDLTDGRAINEDRLAQEIAILADKLDVTEETVRLRAHLAEAAAALLKEEPVGKQLSFLSQEMLREINTIGSKANDAGIAHAVIAMKGELEKIREQIENIE